MEFRGAAGSLSLTFLRQNENMPQRSASKAEGPQDLCQAVHLIVIFAVRKGGDLALEGLEPGAFLGQVYLTASISPTRSPARKLSMTARRFRSLCLSVAMIASSRFRSLRGAGAGRGRDRHPGPRSRASGAPHPGQAGEPGLHPLRRVLPGASPSWGVFARWSTAV